MLDMACGKAQRPCGGRSVGIVCLKQLLNFLVRICKHAALYRLHYPNAASVLNDGLVALAGLYRNAVVIEIVELDLNKLELGVIGEDLVEQLGAVVIGEAEVLDKSLFLLLLYEIEAAVLVCTEKRVGVYVVQQIVIEIACAGLFKLLVEKTLGIALCLYADKRKLVGKQEGFTGMTLYQSLANYDLAGVFVIHICGVEIGETVLKEGVYHLAENLVIYRGGVVFVHKRQTHTAKSEFFHFANLPVLLCQS